jgi:hypothetical protein
VLDWVPTYLPLTHRWAGNVTTSNHRVACDIAAGPKEAQSQTASIEHRTRLYIKPDNYYYWYHA